MFISKKDTQKFSLFQKHFPYLRRSGAQRYSTSKTLAMWSNLNTTASIIPPCAHRYHILGYPSTFSESFNIGPHIRDLGHPHAFSESFNIEGYLYTQVTHMPSPSPAALGTIFISRLPTCLLRLLQHSESFHIPATHMPFPSPSTLVAFSNTFFKNSIF